VRGLREPEVDALWQQQLSAPSEGGGRSFYNRQIPEHDRRGCAGCMAAGAWFPDDLSLQRQGSGHDGIASNGRVCATLDRALIPSQGAAIVPRP